MHRWLFHVINSQQIPKPVVLGSAGFTSFNLPLCVGWWHMDGAWISFVDCSWVSKSSQYCVRKRSAPSVWMTVKGGVIWRTTILIAIIVYINRNQGWYLSKVTTYRKKSKALFLHTGRKKTSESLIELVFRSDFSDHFNIESYEQNESVSADLRAHDGFLAVWRRL